MTLSDKKFRLWAWAIVVIVCVRLLVAALETGMWQEFMISVAIVVLTAGVVTKLLVTSSDESQIHEH